MGKKVALDKSYFLSPGNIRIIFKQSSDTGLDNAAFQIPYSKFKCNV